MFNHHSHIRTLSSAPFTHHHYAFCVERRSLNTVKPNQVFALLRWETDGQLFASPPGCPRRDSQDAWIFRPPIRPVGADFKLGMQRNDNALAYRLWKLGYDLRNPAKTIHIHHLHASAARTFSAAKHFAPPPWLHLEPAELHAPATIHLIRKTFSPKWQFRRLQAWVKRLRTKSTAA